MTFTIQIERWATETNGDKLPICEISSSVEITNALQDYDAFSAEELIIEEENGQYITSFILWRAARVHADIADMTVIMFNLDDKVGAVLYSKYTRFSVDGVPAINKKDVWHSFVVLENEQSIEVKCG